MSLLKSMVLLISQVSTFHSFRWSIGCIQERGGDTSPKFLFGKSASGAVRFLDSLSWTWQGILLFFYVWTFLIQGLNISPIPTPQTAGFWKLTCIKEKFSRKIPLTMSMTRDTCWGNDTRYGCGLTMASFSQRMRCYERPQ